MHQFGEPEMLLFEYLDFVRLVANEGYDMFQRPLFESNRLFQVVSIQFAGQPARAPYFLDAG